MRRTRFLLIAIWSMSGLAPLVTQAATNKFPATNRRTLKVQLEGDGLALSDDGTLMACGAIFDNRNVLEIWSSHRARLIRRIKISTRVSSLVFSPNGKYLIATCEKSVGRSPTGDPEKVICDVRLWEVATGRLLRTMGRWGYEISWAPNGKFVAVSTAYGIELMETTRWRTLRVLKGLQYMPRNIVFSPDSVLLAAYSMPREHETSDLKIWRVNSGRAIVHLEEGDGQTGSFIGAIAFSRDSRQCIAGNSLIKISKGRFKSVRRFSDWEWSWCIYAGSHIHTFTQKNINSSGLSVVIRDITTGKTEQTISGIDIQQIFVSRSGKTAAFVDRDSKIVLFDMWQ